jgi:regulator of protease activity HflC (stomatin/prohibitin superfamily)
MNERNAFSLSGIPVLFVLLAAWLGLAYWMYSIVSVHQEPTPLPFVPGALAFALLFFLNKGFFQVQPNQGQVLQLFGRYSGTVRDAGLRWTNPFYAKRAISLRVRNFESGKLKVNDLDGNPIEIGAIVVWQVVDTAEAVFMVDDYSNFVHIQAE